MPPSWWPPEEAQPVEPLALVGPQLRGQGRGRLGIGELVERQQARDLLLPRPCLALDDAQCGQLLPQARLEPADPQRAAGPVLQGPRLLDERAQRLQLGLLSEKYAPSGSSRCDSPEASARNTSAKGTSRPSTVTLTPRSNQSVSPVTVLVDTPICSESPASR